MIAGLMLGLQREAAARFSFLLATPITFGAAVWSFRNLFKGACLPRCLRRCWRAARRRWSSAGSVLRF